MNETCPPEPPPDEKRWATWPMYFLDRLPGRRAVVISAFLLLGIASLTLESLLKLQLSAGWGPQQRRELIEGIATLIAGLYILTHMAIIKPLSIRAFAQLRSIVQAGEQEYDRLALKMIRADGRIELLLLAAALALVLLFFVLPPDAIRQLPHDKPHHILAIVVILAYYAAVFWLLLSMVYMGIRSTTALSALARRPLRVNVFDPAGLLPFGRLGLLQSLAFVGVFLIPLVIVGPPKMGGGWLVIGLSTLSLLALFVPLWGVHQQIVRERDRVLDGICGDLMQVQRVLLAGAPAEADQLKKLSDRAEALMAFRKHVLSGPSWPFRDVGAVVRAIAAAASPLIYMVLNQLVQTYVFPLFGW